MVSYCSCTGPLQRCRGQIGTCALEFFGSTACWMVGGPYQVLLRPPWTVHGLPEIILRLTCICMQCTGQFWGHESQLSVSHNVGKNAPAATALQHAPELFV